MPYILVVAVTTLFFTVSSANFNVKHYLDKKCIHNEAYLIDKNLRHLSHHLGKSLSYIPDHVEHFCIGDVSSLKPLVRNSSELFRHCVSGEEAYLPNFLDIGFYGFLDFLCSDHGENIRKLYSDEGIHCLNQLKFSTASLDVDKCFDEFSPSRYQLTKHKLCHDISKMKHCFDRVITKYCPANRVMPELNAQLYHSLTAPCRIKEAPITAHGSAGLAKSDLFWISPMLLFMLPTYYVTSFRF